MMLSEIHQIAEVAEKACAATINHPRNIDLRENLFGVLRDVVDLGRVAEATRFARFHDLLRETSVWADLVRCRIEVSRSDPVAHPIALIRHPVGDLKHLLSRLVDEIEHSSDASFGPGGLE